MDEPKNPLAPQALSVRAGPLTALLEGSFLRRITLGETEVVRGVYAAVRDRNWGTIEPRYTRYEVEQGEDSFRVRFTASHRAAEIDFSWDGEIEGAPDGTIIYRFDGRASSTFQRNRIGFCVLHPMGLAGQPVEVETPAGTTAGTFPAAISPHQPFMDLLAIRQPVGQTLVEDTRVLDTRVEVRFEGDLFEMEDQRNWSDASFKTYCTPLRLPFPVQIPAGTRVQQSVTLRLLGTPPAPPRRSPHPVGTPTARVALTPDPIGTLPPIGFGVASAGGPLSGAEIERLRLLRPAHLHVTLDLASRTWREALTGAAAEAAALGAALELEVVAGDGGEGLPELATALRALPSPGPDAAAGGPAPGGVVRAFVFPRQGVVSTEPVLGAARRALAGAGVPVLGGGTRADFVNLNRAADAGALPLPLMGAVAFALNPQVHAFDDRSLVETLQCQGVVLANARRIAGGRPVTAGPITLRQRLNPAATDPTADPDTPESRADPRQRTPFGAAWTLGSLRHLGAAGAASLTYFETAGPLGLMERGGSPYPLWHLFAALASSAGARLLDARPSDPLTLEALALRTANGVRLLLANLTPGPLRVALDAPAFAPGTPFGAPRLLDGTPLGTTDPDSLDLPPYAVAVLDREVVSS